MNRNRLARIDDDEMESTSARLSLKCDGGTRLCEGRRPGSTPGGDTYSLTEMTLKSHGVAAVCKAANSGFDSHRRL